MKWLVIACVAGCGVGDTSTADSGGQVASHITADTTWSGTQQVLADTTIDPGVTVTVMSGTDLAIKSEVSITIAGTLDIEGASGSQVTIQPAGGAASFGELDIVTGGLLVMKHTAFTRGSILTNGTGKATIVDSQLSHAPADLLTMNGGTVDVQYTAIGVEPPATDTSHCDVHFGGLGNVIKLTHTNVSTSSYGVMFYSGQAADFTFTSWFSNSTNVDVQPGVNGDFSNSYFQGAPPTGVGITFANPAGARLPACTGGNDATCAGPRP